MMPKYIFERPLIDDFVANALTLNAISISCGEKGKISMYDFFPLIGTMLNSDSSKGYCSVMANLGLNCSINDLCYNLLVKFIQASLLTKLRVNKIS